MQLKISKYSKIQKKIKKKGTWLSMSGKIAASWSRRCERLERGGENRTGEEEEQRILLETGGDVAAKLSSKKDLFPHRIADMF